MQILTRHQNVTNLAYVNNWYLLCSWGLNNVYSGPVSLFCSEVCRSSGCVKRSRDSGIHEACFTRLPIIHIAIVVKMETVEPRDKRKPYICLIHNERLVTRS